MTEILIGAGYAVVQAADRATALELAERLQPGVIQLDLALLVVVTAYALLLLGKKIIGDLETEFLRCAADIDADLVVMSTHSVTWSASAHSCSIADRVLQRANRPVLLVRCEMAAGNSDVL